jgi:hypothetical protein
MDPQFEIVPKRIAVHRRPPRRARRSWAATIEALTKGRIIFMADDQLSDQDVKYLQLALARRGKGERLTTVRVTQGAVEGRQLELAK